MLGLGFGLWFAAALPATFEELDIEFACGVVQSTHGVCTGACHRECVRLGEGLSKFTQQISCMFESALGNNTP